MLVTKKKVKSDALSERRRLGARALAPAAGGGITDAGLRESQECTRVFVCC